MVFLSQSEQVVSFSLELSEVADGKHFPSDRLQSRNTSSEGIFIADFLQIQGNRREEFRPFYEYIRATDRVQLLQSMLAEI